MKPHRHLRPPAETPAPEEEGGAGRPGDRQGNPPGANRHAAFADEPTTPANDDSPVEPAPPAANTAIVTAANRKRAKRQRPDLPHDPEADERVKAFFVRMIRPGGALPPEKF